LIDEILAKYPNDVKLVIKNFPLSSHKQANKAALYALAAERQGKYIEMYKKIFENYLQLKNDEDLPLQYAVELGLDIEQMKRDITDPSLQDRIQREAAQLKSTGLRMAVPKFLINGVEPPKRDLDTYTGIIDGILKN